MLRCFGKKADALDFLEKNARSYSLSHISNHPTRNKSTRWWVQLRPSRIISPTIILVPLHSLTLCTLL